MRRTNKSFVDFAFLYERTTSLPSRYVCIYFAVGYISLIKKTENELSGDLSPIIMSFFRKPLE